MYFKEIRLKNFRNYVEEKIELHPKVNIITGPNAQGKTNLLEALYIMSLGKSFRTNKDSDLINFNSENAAISTISFKDDRRTEIEIAYYSGEKSVKINGTKTTKHSDILENVYIVIFSPEDLKIVKDEPEKRRRFINIELCQIKPIYYRNLARYKKIITQRNHILKQDPLNKELLDVWSEELYKTGAKLILDRAEFLKKLDKISRKIHGEITDGKERLEILYDSNVHVKENLQDQIDEFRKSTNKNMKVDINRRTTTVGPHKDDLKITIDERDVKSFGSQGQQRTAALSLKLAEIELIKEEAGETPILLLDDVLSELDFSRQKFLINSLKDVQLFITTTEMSDYVKDSLKDNFTFTIINGKINKN
ncbi:MAG: DNA replication/repair protein RecF [Eubacteriales bacterium]